MSIWFQYDSGVNALYPYKRQDAPPSGGTVTILGPYPEDTTDPDVIMAYNFPERYTDSNGVLTKRPFITLDSSETNGTYTVTATLNNAGATPPTSCSFTVGGLSVSEAIANGKAGVSFTFDASAANQSVQVTADATGFVQGKTTVGSGTTVTTKAVVNQGSTVVCPASKSDYENWLFEQMPSIPLLLQQLAATQHLQLDMLNLLLNTVKPTLDANQQQTVTDLQTNVLPKLVLTLESAASHSIWTDTKATLAQFTSLQQKLDVATTNFGY